MRASSNTLIRRLSRLFLYSPNELWVFIASWCIYLKWDVLISVFNYKNWSNNLFNNSSSAQQPSVQQSQNTINAISHHNIEHVKKLIRINETASRNHVRKMNCLRRCLCQKELLNNRAIYTELHIGVKFEEGKLAAHSWLTYNNQLINDSTDIVSTYTELTQQLDSKIINSLSNI